MNGDARDIRFAIVSVLPGHMLCLLGLHEADTRLMNRMAAVQNELGA